MIDIRPLFWVGSSKRDLKEFPDDAQQNVGFALHQAQLGDEHTSVKALKGFGGRGVLEVVERHDGDTYRAVYTVRSRLAFTCCIAFRRRRSEGSRRRRQIWN